MKRFLKTGPAAAISVAALGLLGIAAAMAADAPPTPEDQAKHAVDIRQSILKLQDWNMAPMANMLRRRAPFDAKLVQQNAERIAALSEMLPDAFKPDTTKFDVKTDALPLIWMQKDDFDKKAAALTEAAKALAMTAAGGDQGATFPAIVTMGKACGACHDKFKKQE
jgi:cytochrome c556